MSNPVSAISQPQELSRQPFGNLEPRSCSKEGELPSVFLVLVLPSLLSHGNLRRLADDAQMSAEPCPEVRARMSCLSSVNSLLQNSAPGTFLATEYVRTFVVNKVGEHLEFATVAATAVGWRVFKCGIAKLDPERTARSLRPPSAPYRPRTLARVAQCAHCAAKASMGMGDGDT